VQADAAFCGQCGYHLHTNSASASAVPPTVAPEIPEAETAPAIPEPQVNLQPTVTTGSSNYEAPEHSSLPPTAMSVPDVAEVATSPNIASVPDVTNQPLTVPQLPDPVPQATTPPTAARTQLQQVNVRLLHVQTDRLVELPQNLSVIHMGKPNDRIPPDIDVSGFPNSEIVSRIHADIRAEGDAYYIEDVGSSNGTYINNSPLLPGNRHRLRSGDRISLGKGDLVTFLFQVS
jgi:pSer/pThr/pTyr-binding forkhead associated (FHA) protein